MKLMKWTKDQPFHPFHPLRAVDEVEEMDEMVGLCLYKNLFLT